jgi:hypothetical protein
VPQVVLNDPGRLSGNHRLVNRKRPVPVYVIIEMLRLLTGWSESKPLLAARIDNQRHTTGTVSWTTAAGFAVGAGVPQNCAQASITGRRSSKQSLGAKARKASGSTCPNAILMILEKPLWAAQVPKAYQKPWTVTSVRCIRFTSARMLPWERG